MIVWRICLRQHARQAFRGEGARLYGGRWNPPGLAIVYCAESLALACLEVLVHVDLEDLPNELAAVSCEIPSSVKALRLEVSDLPFNWREYPSPESLQLIGQEWFRRKEFGVLSVPSAVIPAERNYLLDPLHPDFGKVVVRQPEPFSLDPRLWRVRRPTS
ncbi:MAG TPA: RES family NAD+ phosphorylase [Terriglobia bacterium]|nr:RES family NAD+ phosphorylase [Terriglobia bacterium]